MNVLITGGAGFIGSHLSERLLEDGHRVTVIDNLSTGAVKNLQPIQNHDRFRLIVDSILNEETIDEMMREADLVYHLAAAVGVKLIVQEPVRTIETNIRGSEVVLSAANKWRVPVVIASTSEIYGKNNKVPFSEDDDMVLGPTSRNRWSYACSKAIDEFLALAYAREKALRVICVRLFNTVGPRQTGQYGMVLPNFVQQALSGKTITVYGDGTQSRTFCSIFDATKALCALPEHDSTWGQVFNCGGKEEISIHDLAKRVKERTKSSSEIQFLSYDEAYEEGFEDMQRRVPCIDKIRSHIGFDPQHGVDQIVDQVVDYFKHNGHE